MWALRKDERKLTPGQRGTLAQIAGTISSTTSRTGSAAGIRPTPTTLFVVGHSGSHDGLS